MTQAMSQMTQDFWRFPNRLAYVVSHAQPWSSNGYAVRSHAVACALQAAGHEVIVFTRPGRPWDIEGFDQTRRVDLEQIIDGVRYICLPLAALPGAKSYERLSVRAQVLREAFEAFRPAGVLAASNWENAEPARRAAAGIGAAFFYEQRGFWEMGGASRAEEEERRFETEVALGARAVFTLNGLMREELVRRGVPEGRIQLMPNGLPSRGAIDPKITRAALGSQAKYMLGYIGSLSAYEGVEDLVRVIAQLRRAEGGRAALDVDALIVGSAQPKGLIGAASLSKTETALRDLAKSLDVAAHVHFVPQQPEDKIGSYYTLCDALVLPRRRTPVTELVPPIKPYTATAYAVPVFMTDLPPLSEIAREIRASLFAEGDVADLAAQLHQALLHGQPSWQVPMNHALLWSQRILPLSEQLSALEKTETRHNQRLFGSQLSGAGYTGAEQMGGQSETAMVMNSFDLSALPRFELQRQLQASHEARIGPEPGVDPYQSPGKNIGQFSDQFSDQITWLNRSTALDVLALSAPGRFVIDWAGLSAAKAAGKAHPDWVALWSIEDMRLNRLIMDCVTIALERGWRVQVLGPVPRSQAPLFRTVASVVEEIVPSSQKS